MNSLERRTRRKSLKERLGFMSCCGGAVWSNFSNPSNINVREAEEEQEEEDEFQVVVNEQEESRNVVFQIPAENVDVGVGGDQACPAELTVSGMNLATALAAERQFRATGNNNQVDLTEGNEHSRTYGTPMRVSLMKLLEQGDGVDEGVGNDGVCCVCMGRRKGAAFIPCGHTFCRVCSRELWLNRGSCPICNRPILEILDIF